MNNENQPRAFTPSSSGEVDPSVTPDCREAGPKIRFRCKRCNRLIESRGIYGCECGSTEQIEEPLSSKPCCDWFADTGKLCHDCAPKLSAPPSPPKRGEPPSHYLKGPREPWRPWVNAEQSGMGPIGARKENFDHRGHKDGYGR